MAVVFLDTNIVLWGILGQSKPDQKGMIPKAKYLFEDLSKKHHDVHISSVTLAEVLCGIPANKQHIVREAISKHLMVIPFDTLAAKHYGLLWREMKDNGTYCVLQEEFSMIRREFVADCMILGTAISRHASMLYTNDKKLKKLASQHLEIPDLPKIPEKMLPLPLTPLEQCKESHKKEANL